MDTVVITVVVPVYQVERYLGRCVESILKQQYSNLDVILVDDGSKDSSSKICDDYAAKDSRIRVIHKTNGGLSSARNVGISAARGKYIAFIDSDDCINPAMISTLYHICCQYHTNIAMCRYMKFSDDSEIVNIEQPLAAVKVFSSQEALGEIYGYDAVTYVVAWNKLYDISLFDKVRYKEGKLNEDEFTTYKLFAEAEKIAVSNQQYYYYFQNMNSITRNERYFTNTDIFEALIECADFYKKKGDRRTEKLAKKAYVNRIIRRYQEVQDSISDRTAIQESLLKRYHQFYQENKNDIPGFGYQIFNASPKMYYFLLKIKTFL